MKKSAKFFVGAYVLGIWVYGLWYVWEHWAGSNHIGSLAGRGFIRAVVWPWWVLLDLIQR